MRYDFTPEQIAWREEIRAFVRDHLGSDLLDELREVGNEGQGPLAKAFIGKLRERGWWGLPWPAEYGGLGRSAIDQWIFVDELESAGAPMLPLTVTSVAPTIMRVGSEEQKQHWLPRIKNAEVEFALGYSEPDAGTDLAALRTRADLDGDTWVVNGQKMWNTMAHMATHNWLAVRTEPDAPKHKGISMIIVPTNTPGFRCVPIKNMGDMNTNQTFYDDVRVPASNLVGKLNGGWKLITNQLNHERVTLCSSGMIEGLYEDTVKWAKETRLANGQRVIDQPWVQLNLARVYAGLDYMRLMNFKIAWGAEQGQPMNPAQASCIKVFGTEFYLQACRLMLEVMGAAATVRGGSVDAVVAGRVSFFMRSIHILTFGGGTNELQRDLICLFGLGMPVAPRAFS